MTTTATASALTPRVLLVRPAYHTGLTRTVRIVTEPLELEVLGAVASAHGWDYEIYDPVVTRERFGHALTRLRPQVVALTGYYPARDQMLALAREARRRLPGSWIVCGGVHAELNHGDIHRPDVDWVVHSGGGDTFGRLLDAWTTGPAPVPLPGTCRRQRDDTWRCGPRAVIDPTRLPRPDRRHFHEHRDAYSYLDWGSTALVQTAFGCPYECDFCYCRRLNEGRYLTRDPADVVDEIAAIDCDAVWLVDDTFLIDPQRLARFAEALAARGVERRFIIYSRADYLARHPEAAALLRQMGVVEVIVGFEAVDQAQLDDYHKGVTDAQNRQCIAALASHGLHCTGLFIMGLDATRADFDTLIAWTRESGLTTFTASIYSPFPGTPEYDARESELLTTDCRKWDLVHLVLPPTNLSRAAFYAHLTRVHLHVAARSRRLRRHLLRQLVPRPVGRRLGQLVPRPVGQRLGLGGKP